jgi:hypothetical protein
MQRSQEVEVIPLASFPHAIYRRSARLAAHTLVAVMDNRFAMGQQRLRARQDALAQMELQRQPGLLVAVWMVPKSV